ncbi:MAG: HlyD family type I secretion periplasmic adaptor subunit [Rhodoferax sp.]|nr:HlyD family type I secretion periplasmic adaptor subunit [Rhodoferax sp.]
MEPANQPFVKRWLRAVGVGPGKPKTLVEYLPDADEIERSPTPRYAQLTLQLLVVALGVFILWACVSQLEQVVVAQGRLVNPLPNVVVQPLETGMIQSVDVRVGQVVKKGDSLATLDATFAQADESQLKLRMGSLETQIGGIQQELSGGKIASGTATSADGMLQADLLSERRANYQAQQLKLSENAGRLRAALATNRQDQQLILTRLRSMKEIEAMQEKMVAQKYGAPLQLLEAQQRSQEVSRELEIARSREGELKRELAAFEAEKTAFEKGWRQKSMEDLLNLTRERDSIEQQLQKADRRSKMVTLTAPTDAVVLEIAKLSPGSIIREAETFFTLVPLNSVLEAEVQFNSVDVGYIKAGHPVHLKLDSYPFQRHGTIDGKVVSISEDAFKRDTQQRGGVDAYYLGRIRMDKPSLKNMLPGTRLLPGMTLSAEIVVGQRSVMSYLVWPLTKGMDEAIREPR